MKIHVTLQYQRQLVTKSKRVKLTIVITDPNQVTSEQKPQRLTSIVQILCRNQISTSLIQSQTPIHGKLDSVCIQT